MKSFSPFLQIHSTHSVLSGAKYHGKSDQALTTWLMNFSPYCGKSQTYMYMCIYVERSKYTYIYVHLHRPLTFISHVWWIMQLWICGMFYTLRLNLLQWFTKPINSVWKMYFACWAVISILCYHWNKWFSICVLWKLSQYTQLAEMCWTDVGPTS